MRLVTLLVLSTLLRSPQQGAAQVVTVTGVVQDQTGAVLIGASVELAAGGRVVRSVATDDVGAFHFDGVAPGTYELRAHFEGFKDLSSRVRVGSRAPSPQKLVLQIASIAQDVTVSNVEAGVNAGASGNQDAVTLDQEMLSALPVLDRDLIATASRFLDPAALGSGVTIVVNGMEVSALNVSCLGGIADPDQPGPVLSGVLAAGPRTHRDPDQARLAAVSRRGSTRSSATASLNARNAFASAKPQEQRQSVEGFFGGPIGDDGKTMFMVSANDEHDASQAYIHAIGPARTDRWPAAAHERRSARHRQRHAPGERDRTRSRFVRTISTRAMRTATPGAPHWPARRRRSSITSSRSPTRSRQSSRQRS